MKRYLDQYFSKIINNKTYPVDIWAHSWNQEHQEKNYNTKARIIDLERKSNFNTKTLFLSLYLHFLAHPQ